MQYSAKTAILGIGNELLGDEGVGIHAVRMLNDLTLPEEAVAVEVGTAILDALPILEKSERIIVVDAMKDGGPPGTIYKIPLDHCSGAVTIGSMHGFDIFRVMALVERTSTPPVMVFGVEPESIGWSMELSATVAASMGPLVDAVRKELTES